MKAGQQLLHQPLPLLVQRIETSSLILTHLAHRPSSHLQLALGVRVLLTLTCKLPLMTLHTSPFLLVPGKKCSNRKMKERKQKKVPENGDLAFSDDSSSSTMVEKMDEGSAPSTVRRGAAPHTTQQGEWLTLGRG
jgi:hypothetical protein